MSHRYSRLIRSPGTLPRRERTISRADVHRDSASFPFHPAYRHSDELTGADRLAVRTPYRRPLNYDQLLGMEQAIAPAWYRFLRDPVALAALSVLLLLGLAALLAPVLVPFDPSRLELAQAGAGPSWSHPLGTDTLGRDLLSRALHGGRVSLAVGLSAAAIAALLGVTLGLGAAYHGGWLDALVTRLVDAALAVPAFFLLVAIQSATGQSVVNVILMVSLVGWMMEARVVRAITLSLKEQEFVLAARALGCSGGRILLRHLLPNLASQVGVLFALGVADALLIESALSFLGMGVPPTEPSWGNMLADAQAAILSGAWGAAALPGMLILITALSINLAGDGLARALSPDS